MKKFLRSMISDERGAVSSKRIIAIVCVFCLCTILFYPLFCDSCKTPSEFIIDAIKYITMVSLGSTSIDKFTSKEQEPIVNQNENVN